MAAGSGSFSTAIAFASRSLAPSKVIISREAYTFGQPEDDDDDDEEKRMHSSFTTTEKRSGGPKFTATV